MTNEELQKHPSILACIEIMENKREDGVQIMMDLVSRHTLEAKDEMDKFHRDGLVKHLSQSYRHLQILAEVNKYMDSFYRISNGDKIEESAYSWRFMK